MPETKGAGPEAILKKKTKNKQTNKKKTQNRQQTNEGGLSHTCQLVAVKEINFGWS